MKADPLGPQQKIHMYIHMYLLLSFRFSDSESGIWAEACGKPCSLVLECVVSVRSRMCVMKHDSKYTRLVYTHRTRTYVKHSFQLEMVRQ